MVINTLKILSEGFQLTKWYKYSQVSQIFAIFAKLNINNYITFDLHVQLTCNLTEWYKSPRQVQHNNYIRGLPRLAKLI